MRFVLVILALIIAATIAMVNADQIEDEYYESKLTVAAKFVKFIEHFGLNAWHFLECLGLHTAIKCEKPILETLTHPDVAHAVSLVECEGADIARCAPKLKE